MRQSIELKEERMKLTTEYRGVLSTVKAAKRDYTPDETEKLRVMDARLDTLDTDILRHEKQEEREAVAARDPRADATRDSGTNDGKVIGIRGTVEYGKAFTGWLKNGGMASATPEIRAALQSDSDTSGGYLSASEQFSSNFIKFVDDQVFIRQMATKETVVTAQSLGIPTLAADPTDADWTPEIGTGTEDSQMAFGKRELYPHPLAKRIKISKKLLRMKPDVDSLVMKRLAYKFGISEEKAFLLGTGVQQPLGLFVPTTDGIDTSRDVLSGAVNGFTAAAGADALFDALYTLKAQYQAKATWLFHRDLVRQIRKLKATTNEYLWQPSIQAAEPSTILGRPFYMSEYVPNTLTTGLYVGMVGDFSQYYIADAFSMGVQRLEELYAESNQTGFIGRQEVDGMPVLAEAFVRIKNN
jgi:HK97 family phage major capsid protein